MSSSTHEFEQSVPLLPQCGFAADIDFDTLIKSNRFLFRVYTPKERSPFSDDTDPFFVAPRFNEQVARSPVDLPNIKFPETVVGTYAEVARHMEWTTKSTSCYLSTSFSFAWAIWEAVRRYHVGVKKDVEIAIIDSAALDGRAATAVQLLKKSHPKQRDQQFWKWYRFSQASQTVLVYGMVPREAVLASIPILQILRKMPSYFLQKDVQVISGNPLDVAAWDYTNRKLNFRQFCQDMSTIFLARPEDVKLRDTTGGAVRLALSFLRPFFHRVVQDDFDSAISYLRSLAISISEWPGDGWVRRHPEVRQVVESMVLALGEELREKYANQTREEVTRLKFVIDGLEHTIKAHDEEVAAALRAVDDVEVDSDGGFEVVLGQSEDLTFVTQPEAPVTPPRKTVLRRRLSSLEMSVAVVPRLPIQTPITPPDSPRNSMSIPTVTIPLGDLIPTPFTFRPLLPPFELREGPSGASTRRSTTTSPTTPASPPPTPPPRQPVFIAPMTPVRERSSLHEIEKADDSEVVETTKETVDEKQDPGDGASESGAREEVEELERTVESTLEKEVMSNAETVLSDYEDGEDTDIEEDDVNSQQFPLSSPFSSPRSSIYSMDTLIDSSPPNIKRHSLSASRTGSFDYRWRRFSPPGSVGIPSRTVSFSEPMMGFMPFTPPAINPLMIELPTSPALSVKSLHIAPTEPPSLSRTPSTSSPSVTTPSSLSSPSPSQASPLPRTPSPPPVVQEKTLTPPALPSILRPKRSVSLLTPLPSPQYEEEEDSTTDTSSVLSVNMGETASYIVTGFLVGAFITIFLFSTQRKALLYVT